jgi:hypothetical protein
MPAVPQRPETSVASLESPHSYVQHLVRSRPRQMGGPIVVAGDILVISNTEDLLLLPIFR